MAEAGPQAGGAVAVPSGRQPLSNQRIGSPLSEFLDKEGIRDEVDVYAIKQVLTWQSPFPPG